jgi:hypothetical protein
MNDLLKHIWNCYTILNEMKILNYLLEDEDEGINIGEKARCNTTVARRGSRFPS